MNRTRNILARRYAEAFLKVFFDQVTVDNLENFKEASGFFKKRPHGMFLMEISLIPEERKRQFINDLCQRFTLPEGCEKLCLLLIKCQRASLLPEIFNYIIAFKERDLHITHFAVTSSSELSDQQKDHIIHFLDIRVQGAIDYTYRVDTSLIAGIRLQSTSLLWEKSVKKRLRELQESLR